MDQTTLVPLGFFLMVVVLAIGTPLVRAFTRNMDRKGGQQALPPGVDERLLQMQHSIDAVALEIERISEAQRFTTRLLAEGGPRQPDSLQSDRPAVPQQSPESS